MEHKENKEIDYENITEHIDDEIRKTFNISNRQLKKLQIKTQSFWSITENMLFLKDGNDEQIEEYYDVNIQNNPRCTFVSCSDKNEKEHVFILRNGRMKTFINDKMTLYQRLSKIDRLNDDHKNILTEKLLEKIDSKKIVDMTEEDYVIHDNLLDDYIKINLSDFEDQKVDVEDLQLDEIKIE